jgi:hypothetical protein
MSAPAFQDSAGSQVVEKRVGSRTFGVRYIRRPELMSRPQDTPFPLPADVHELVALKATELWARRIGRADVADSAFARYTRLLDEPRVLKHQKREGATTRIGNSMTARAHDLAVSGVGPMPDGAVWVSTYNLPVVQ